MAGLLYDAAGESALAQASYESALDASVALLEELLSKPGLATVPRLRTDPAFDPLREHPRFRKLVAERS